MKACFSLGLFAVGMLVPLSYLGGKEAPIKVDDPDVTFMRMIRVEEKRSADSYRNSSGSIAHSNKHVLAFTFKTLASEDVATSGGLNGGLPTSTSTSTSSTGTTGIDPGGTTGMMFLEPGGGLTGETTGLTTGESTGTTGTTGGPGYETLYGYYFYVASSGEMAPIGSRTPTAYNYSSSIPDLPTGTRIHFFPGEEVTVHMASDAALSSGSLTVTVELYTLVHYFDDPGTVPDEEAWDANSAFSKVEYDVTKYLCDDASIDTRKAHGTPNREGELPDDPNAAPAALNFGGSIWKGGLFAGNMHWTTRDQSGLARIQIYPQGTSGREDPPRMAALTMFYRGTPPNVTGSVTLGAYTPGDSDPNLTSSASTVTWANRWNLAPQEEPDDPRDPSKDPMFRVPFSSSTLTGEYATWTLTDTFETTALTPDNVMKAIGIAIETETDFVSEGTTAWRYFASEEWPSQVANTFPNNDSMPRLWLVDYVDRDDFNFDWTSYWWWPEEE